LKTSYFKTGEILFIVLILVAIVTCSPVISAAKPSRVAVIPFKINAAKDLSFLRDGIVDMLTSRLFWADRVEVIRRQLTEKALEDLKGRLNEKKVLEIGAGLDADYVLFGSLTVFGNSVSIDAKMIHVSGKKPPLSFFNQSKGMGEVIPKINLFATQINEKVFGRVIVSKPTPVQPKAERKDIYAHPEKLVKGGFGADKTEESDEDQGPAFGRPQGPAKRSRQFWKSQNFKVLINGLALGDVDGDGKVETAVITPHEVHLYRCESGRLFKIKQIAKDRNRSYLGVDAADINGNGYAEIFVTSLNAHKNAVRSFVLEYNGRSYTRIVKKSKWYFRVVELPGRGKVLLAQKQSSGGPFKGGIFEMTWQKSKYVPEKQILSSRENNLLGLAYGNVMNDGTNRVVAYNDSDHIQVIDPSGKVAWEGKEHYGGSMLYFAIPKKDPDDIENQLYLPMRLHIRDIDADGRNEVIAVKNIDIVRGKLEYRKFTHAQIETLTWDGLGLGATFKTRKISGQMSDFAMGDFDNDGKDELVAAVIMKTGSLIGTSPKSSIIAHDLTK